MDKEKSNYEIFLELEREYVNKNKKIPLKELKRIKINKLNFNFLSRYGINLILNNLYLKINKHEKIHIRFHDYETGLATYQIIPGPINCSIKTFTKLMEIAYFIIIPSMGGTLDNGGIIIEKIEKNIDNNPGLLRDLEIFDGLKERFIEVLNNKRKSIFN
jgi:hypothetical protein